MPESAVDPMWLVRLPHDWPGAPAWMSFSDLQNIETCPRRWSLSAASYPNIWSHRGYPPKIYLATLYGRILHGALELIVKSLNRASCSSVADESFVNVMRGLGGYTSIIQQAATDVLDKLNENPRFTPRSRYVVAELTRAAPTLCENLQVLIGKLRLGGAHFGVGAQQPRRSALNEGTYSEIQLRVAKMHWHGFVDRDLTLRSRQALAEIRKTPPRAVASMGNCTFCSVRQLCDEYWTDTTQELLAQEKSSASGSEARHLADLEVEIREQESPSIWRAVTLHGHALPPNSEVVLRIPAGDTMLRPLMSRGRCLRLVDASLIQQTDDEYSVPVVTLQRSSEVFVL